MNEINTRVDGIYTVEYAFDGKYTVMVNTLCWYYAMIYCEVEYTSEVKTKAYGGIYTSEDVEVIFG